jgi:hypothetical protein
VAGIERLKNLELLWLHDTQVEDLEPVASLTALTELDLASLRPVRWDFLRPLTKLETLDLFDTPFDDVTLLQQLPKLLQVRLAGTKLEKGSPGVRALDETLMTRGEAAGLRGRVSFEAFPHWRHVTPEVLQLLEPEPAPPPVAEAPPPGVTRRYFEWSSFFFEVFVRDVVVVSREGRTYDLGRAKRKVKRFKTVAQANDYANKLCTEAQQPKPIPGGAVREFAPKDPTIPPLDASAFDAE